MDIDLKVLLSRTPQKKGGHGGQAMGEIKQRGMRKFAIMMHRAKIWEVRDTRKKVRLFRTPLASAITRAVSHPRGNSGL